MRKSLDRASRSDSGVVSPPVHPFCAGVSVVIPTRNESPNIGPLVKELNLLPAGCLDLVIFVDDSDDDTCDQIEIAAEGAMFPVLILHRPSGQRTGGLGGAVLYGIHRSRSPWVCVMDGDLQHPPATILKLIDHANSSGSDIVIGSRYSDGGRIAGLQRSRRTASNICTWVTRLLFRRRLRIVADPLSGYFLVQRDRLHLDGVMPDGYKILLELLVQHPEWRSVDAGYVFSNRRHGESKACLREGWRLLTLLCRLRTGIRPGQFLRFAAVGTSGFVVNLGLAALLVYLFSLSYLSAAILATQGSTLWNFFWYDRWVFADRRENREESESLAKSYLVNNAAFVLRGPTIYILTALFHFHYLSAIFASLLMFTVIRYSISSAWIWPSSRKETSLRHESVGD